MTQETRSPCWMGSGDGQGVIVVIVEQHRIYKNANLNLKVNCPFNHETAGSLH
jgi:hypothetical protein